MIFCVSEEIPEFDGMATAEAGQPTPGYSNPEMGNTGGGGGGGNENANVAYVPPPPPQGPPTAETQPAKADESVSATANAENSNANTVDLLDTSHPAQEQSEHKKDAAIDTQVVHSINSLD